MGKAIPNVFTESYHGLCTFHIMQNVVKHLSPVKGQEKESHILSDFSACMYRYEDKIEFEEAFDSMRSKVHKQTWLDSIYKVKEKWAECYMRDVFSLGVRSTQLSESFNSSLKNHLKSDFDIVRFLKHFERTVEETRARELEAEFEARKKLPRRRMCTPMLIQASDVYTPVIFEAFQVEYERSMAACTTVLDGDNKYTVTIGNLSGDLSFEEERIVTANPFNQTTDCSCQMFNRTRILCAHGLKVLDLMNIKMLPTHYVLKRWTREACSGSILDRQGREVVENPKLEAQLRLRSLSHKFLNMAYKAAISLECCLLIDNALDLLGPQVEDKLNAPSSVANEKPCNDQENISPNMQQRDDLLGTAQLKKKEVQLKGSKRKKSWIEKLRKGKRKATKSAVPTKKGAKKEDGAPPHVQVENNSSNKEANVDLHEYRVIGDFTRLLTSMASHDENFYDEDLF
ncbi:protein FAR1-RELATED SEQUENCE 5 [Zea mays]|uniref:protein FAR1-RELATED SEQUENCE 5 n=1 Tax=Zea mays TaxID=4577 RepID=UPI0004DEB953|nr:protein FAR1-RELATED SEQUENCE 5 [Zea mays]